MKISEKRLGMAWLLTWLNVSVAILIATLQLLIIYRLKPINEGDSVNYNVGLFWLDEKKNNSCHLFD